jgi:hypothetical protein
MKKLLIFYFIILLSVSTLFSQTLIPKITTETKSIKQSYLKDIENLKNSLEQYINLIHLVTISIKLIFLLLLNYLLIILMNLAMKSSMYVKRL